MHCVLSSGERTQCPIRHTTHTAHSAKFLYVPGMEILFFVFEFFINGFCGIVLYYLLNGSINITGFEFRFEYQNVASGLLSCVRLSD